MNRIDYAAKMSRPIYIFGLLMDMDSVQTATIHEDWQSGRPGTPEATYTYSVWMWWKGQPGCSRQMIGRLTRRQAEFIRDDFNRALASGEAWDLRECLRRYDAGFTEVPA